MLQNVTKQSKSHNAVSVLNNHEEVECDEKVTTLRVKGWVWWKSHGVDEKITTLRVRKNKKRLSVMKNSQRCACAKTRRGWVWWKIHNAARAQKRVGWVDSNIRVDEKGQDSLRAEKNQEVLLISLYAQFPSSWLFTSPLCSIWCSPSLSLRYAIKRV
jgi:hypothetical protein